MLSRPESSFDTPDMSFGDWEETAFNFVGMLLSLGANSHDGRCSRRKLESEKQGPTRKSRKAETHRGRKAAKQKRKARKTPESLQQTANRGIQQLSGVGCNPMQFSFSFVYTR